MKTVYKPKEFSQMIGKSVLTLQRWDKKGILKAHRSPTDRRYYTQDQYIEYLGLKATSNKKTVVYARVSTKAQKADLKNQIDAIKVFCDKRLWKVDEWIEEIASGLNYRRKKFNDLMMEIELGQVGNLIIAHKDRLVRFGFEWFESFCERHGTKLFIVNGDSLSPEQELVQDLLSIVHVFSARLYGLRSYRKAIKDAASQKDQNPDKRKR
ncbi:MAG TPA: IS607 family transposase [Bacilli bacterium]|nr:IS607 family transposase [Bacilli bacterium]